MKQGNSPRGAKPAVVVRRARESDLPAIDGLYHQLKPGEYERYAPRLAKFRQGFRKISRSRDHHLMVAVANGQVVGTIHVLIFRHLGHGTRPSAIVENVVVADTIRSQGIGEKMLEAAKAIALREGCYKVALTSRMYRAAAHRFYERAGWKHSHAGYSIYFD